MTSPKNDTSDLSPTNFIHDLIDEHLQQGRYTSIATRFPPEPNGYLHIGHAKSICLNFGIAQKYPNSTCFLRFDDTNPEKESEEYSEAIKRDVQWLGFTWNGPVRHTSDYFEQIYNYALALIRLGKAYVCELSAEDMKNYRGTLTQPGKNSPYRDRSVEENLRLFEAMKAGKFEEGTHVLRAKIDMASPNISMRDPVIYRVRKTPHMRTGNHWCIYPMYDFSHCLSDYIENITHSICTLEFQDNRQLYDWFLEQLTPPPRPHQYEFSRLNLNYTVMSKRRLKTLVDEGFVDAWDDPRMPTIAGLRRRGYTPASIRALCQRIGVSKRESILDISLLEDSLRNDLNEVAARVMCVIRPLEVEITNLPADQTFTFEAANHPQKPEMGSRSITFGRTIYIEHDDFMEQAPKDFFRLAPGREVRLRYGHVIKCERFDKDPVSGEITKLYCTYDADTLNKKPEGRKVKGVIHWVDAKTAVPMQVNLYDRLFTVPNPSTSDEEGSDWRQCINPQSKVVLERCFAEPVLAAAKEGDSFQFERLGYFCCDKSSKPAKVVFNRSVTLRDSWSKEI